MSNVEQKHAVDASTAKGTKKGRSGKSRESDMFRDAIKAFNAKRGISSPTYRQAHASFQSASYHEHRKGIK